MAIYLQVSIGVGRYNLSLSQIPGLTCLILVQDNSAAGRRMARHWLAGKW